MWFRFSSACSVALLWLGLVGTVGAEPSFTIKHFSVSGSSLISSAEIGAVLQPHTGPQRRFADIEAARQELQSLFIERGYSTVKVLIPEQEISTGLVRFIIEEHHIGQVTVFGAKHHDETNIRASLPGLREGELPNVIKVAESLRLANENPSKNTQLVFRPGSRPNELEALLRVEDSKPWKAFAGLDNSGSAETGRSRMTLGYQHSNLFNRDHVLTLQTIVSPEQFDQVSIFGAGYRIPLYDWHSAIDLYAGYSDVDSGTVAGLFDISGRGRIYGARFSHLVPKTGQFEHRISLGLDYRAYENNIRFLGNPLGTDVTVRPLSLGYHGKWTGKRSLANYHLGFHANLPGVEHGKDLDFALARGGADARYKLFRAGLDLSHSLTGDWQLRGRIKGQYSDEPLVSGEQFTLGGADSLRGLQESLIGGDSGLNASLELYTPDFAAKTPVANDSLRFLAFVDAGQVDVINAGAGQASHTQLLSAGLGLRYGIKDSLNLSLDIGRVIDDGNINGLSKGRVHGSMSYVF